MGKQYGSELKGSIPKKILSPGNVFIPDISGGTGIPVDTLYAWRTKYRSRSQETGVPLEEEKLSAIVEGILGMVLNVRVGLASFAINDRDSRAIQGTI